MRLFASDPITTDDEHTEALERFDALMSQKTLSDAEKIEMSELSAEIEKFEEKRWPI